MRPEIFHVCQECLSEVSITDAGTFCHECQMPEIIILSLNEKQLTNIEREREKKAETDDFKKRYEEKVKSDSFTSGALTGHFITLILIMIEKVF